MEEQPLKSYVTTNWSFIHDHDFCPFLTFEKQN